MNDWTDALPEDVDVLLERAAKFHAILRESGNAPIVEAAILTRLARLILPDADDEMMRAIVKEIRAYVGLED